jgi:hypothetical protein
MDYVGLWWTAQVVLSLEIFAVHHPLLIDETYPKII